MAQYQCFGAGAGERLRAVAVRLRGAVMTKLRQVLTFLTNFNNFTQIEKKLGTGNNSLLKKFPQPAA